MFKQLVLFGFVACSSFGVFAADEPKVPDYAGKYTVNVDDKKAIEAVVEEFGRAIREKDGEALKSLFLYDDIFFHSAPTQETIDQIREKRDADYLKKHPTGMAMNFVKFISESEQAIEERFYNVKITQDTDFALVVFDYDFRIGGQVTNYGLETWQMFKMDGNWRIATVVWSSTNADS